MEFTIDITKEFLLNNYKVEEIKKRICELGHDCPLKVYSQKFKNPNSRKRIGTVWR